MPSGAQSLTPATPTPFGSFTDGNLYKGSIDSCLSVYSQPGGAFYVYPNSPAGMSVLVDVGYSYGQTGTAIINNVGGGPVTVALVAPGSNSYYATIYFDQVTSNCGVIYGLSSVSPLPIYPDNVWQVALATVLISSSTTSITATQIDDIRSWIPQGPLTKVYGSIAASQTLICLGARLVAVSLAQSVNLVLTLTYISNSTPVTINVSNSTGGVLNFKLAASTPGGVTCATQVKTAGATAGYASFSATGFAVAAGSGYVFSGVLIGNVLSMVGS